MTPKCWVLIWTIYAPGFNLSLSVDKGFHSNIIWSLLDVSIGPNILHDMNCILNKNKHNDWKWPL